MTCGISNKKWKALGRQGQLVAALAIRANGMDEEKAIEAAEFWIEWFS